MRFSHFSPILFLAASYALAHAGGAPAIEVTRAWARATPPAVEVGAVYFSIINRGAKADQLLAVSSSIAGHVEIHESRNVNGAMQMRPVATVNCPAGATVKVEPGGLHVMLLGLRSGLALGSHVDLTLTFRDAGSLSIQVPVQNGPES